MIKNIYFIFWLTKPQPNLHTGDTCLGPKGVPEYRFHCNEVNDILLNIKLQ